MRLRDYFLAVSVAVAVLIPYLLTVAPTVATNDAGRFQTAAPLLGTGHPTGYPTFILFGKLFTFLPVGDIAFRLNLMAAVFGALAAALAFLVTRTLGASRTASAGGAFLISFCATFWSQATFAEVYTMHVTFILGVTLLMLRFAGGGSAANLIFAALLYGISLGNNAGMILFAPTFAILLLAARRRLNLRSLVASAVAGIIGASVYLYIPLRGFAGAYHNYGDPVNDWNDVWRLVSGARFQSLMGVSPAEFTASFASFSFYLANQTLQPFGYALAAILVAGGIVGALMLFRRDALVSVALMVGLIIALVYALEYDIDDISVYYIPVYVVLTLFATFAFSEVSSLTRSSPPGVVLLVVAALVFGLNFAPLDKSGYYTERERSEAILAALPEDAILYGKVPIVPLTYLHEIEDERPGITLRWLDGGTIEGDFPADIESGRPVFFLSDERYDEQYVSDVAPLAEATDEGDFIRLTPRE